MEIRARIHTAEGRTIIQEIIHEQHRELRLHFDRDPTRTEIAMENALASLLTDPVLSEKLRRLDEFSKAPTDTRLILAGYQAALNQVIVGKPAVVEPARTDGIGMTDIATPRVTRLKAA